MYIVSCATNLEIEIILIRLYHSPHITPVIPTDRIILLFSLFVLTLHVHAFI